MISHAPQRIRRCAAQQRRRSGSAILLGLLVLASGPAHALEIWSGRDYYFERGDFVDWTLPENQDRITPGVWITRQWSQGIFNIKVESGYQHYYSPADTEWATGDAVDSAALTFEPWETWAGNYPLGAIGVDAVVHLISEDIYLDIRFESWTCCANGGGFAYYRATGPPTPVRESTWGRLKSLFDR